VEFAGGGVVEFRLERSGANARLQVINAGPPLPDTSPERLFDSMVSVRRAADQTDEPHLGLGLYIVRIIAQFHGGHAVAANRSDGGGVVITVTLPLA